MTKKVDEEVFFDQVISILQAGLPSKLTEIDAEKDDGIIIPQIPSDRYLETLNEEALNFSEFIYMGVIYPKIEGQGAATARTIIIFIDALFQDNPAGPNDKARKLVMRYTRAMREVAEEAVDDFLLPQIEVIQQAPTNLQSIDEDSFYRVGGIRIQGVIA